MMNAKNAAEEIFRAAVDSVKPDKIVRRWMSLSQGRFRIGDESYDLNEVRKLRVIGFGKASANMAEAVEEILGDRISGGLVITKYGHGSTLKFIEVAEAGHPVPDENGFAATRKILDLAKDADERDLVICLISGGGSALLADYPPGSSPQDLKVLNDLLLKSGADIQEMNAVRKHLSMVKGGQLARALYPARIVSLILSDVIGDPLDVIASGPTAPDPSTFAEAHGVLVKYGLDGKIPRALRETIEAGLRGAIPETLKPGDPVRGRITNLIIGSNRIALEAAAAKSETLGFHPRIMSSDLRGDSAQTARGLVELAVREQAEASSKKPLSLLFGGETTIRVSGGGLGGRNQHLALVAATALTNTRGITLLAAGTDGNDGPTDAAGAVVDSETCARAEALGLSPESYLATFDSYHFFEKTDGHVITGPTMTNVMDLIIILIE